MFDLAEPTWRFQVSQSDLVAHGVDGSDDTASGTDVEAAVHAIMEVIGVEPASFRADSSRSVQLVEVRIEFTPDGLRTDVVWNLTVAPDGTIVGGDGPVRAPQVVGEVGTIDLDEALLRLSRMGTNGLVAGDQDTLPVVSAVRAGLVSVWDISNRPWLVPAVVVSSNEGFTATIPIAASVHFLVSEADEPSGAPVRTIAPLTIPSVSMPPPTTTTSTPPATTAVVPGPSNPPPATTTLPWTAPTLPRPTLPPPSATLVATDGTPITLPMPPDPNETNVEQMPGWYEDELNALLVSRALDEAVTVLELTGWVVRTDDLDDPTDAPDAELLVGRVTVQHRNGVVVNITIG